MSGMTRKPLTSAALHQVIIRTSGSVARSCSFAGGRPGHKRSDRIPKYVASRTLTEVGWQNAQLLGPDVPAAVQKLRAEPGGEIHVWGSAELIKALAEHDLIDEYRLAVYPIVLGTGKKLFCDGFALAKLTLVETRALRSGVLVNTYRRSDVS